MPIQVDPRLIYDVGMHLGEDTDFYLKKGFRVVAIEAMQEFCQRVAERFAVQVANGQLRIIHCAISAQAGPVSFYLNEKKSVWGTADAAFAALRSAQGAAVQRVEVPGLPFADIVREQGMPYFLKIDIEGADRQCLEGLRGFEARPRLVSIEAEILSWPLLVQDFQTLTELGYDRFKVVQQLTVRRQRCPNPPREGLYVDHRFPKGASGTFGEEAPGNWLSAAQALARFRPIYRNRRWFGSGGYLAPGRLSQLLVRDILQIRPGWHDIQARLRSA